MSSLGKLAGYQCEFTSPVADDLLCKKCNLVARKLSATTCCGESYCYQCIADISQLGNPCPECNSQEFSFIELIKYQKRIHSLKVNCSMKERGCDWSGTIDQLDTHFDADLDNCQYVDTKCPLNCQQLIPKNKVVQHVAQECTKRAHVCQHCGYEATYEEIVDTHIPECKYVPLQCPNFCGVSCDREDMEDHMKICLKEKVECLFKDMGCKEKFQREYEETHEEERMSNHLSLTAAECISIKGKLVKYEDKILEQEQCLRTLERTKKELSKKINFLERKLSQLFEVVINSDQFRSFQIQNFSSVTKESTFFFKSPVMCIQTGAKFFISIWTLKQDSLAAVGVGAAVGAGAGAAGVGGEVVGVAAGTGVAVGTAVGMLAGGGVGGIPLFFPAYYLYATAHAIISECDDDLTWPVRVEITLEIIKKREQHFPYVIRRTWDKPDLPYEDAVRSLKCEFGLGTQLGRVSALKERSVNDILQFRVTNIRLDY